MVERNRHVLGCGGVRVELALGLGIDRDPEAMERAWAHAGKDARLIPAPGRFGELETIVHATGKDKVDGVMLDLGVSSFQIDEAGRGFSFMRDGPLDMRMAADGLTAAELVNTYEQAEISRILWIYGEERASRRIAKAIVKPEQLYTRTVEVDERVRADGTVEREPDLDAVRRELEPPDAQDTSSGRPADAGTDAAGHGP